MVYNYTGVIATYTVPYGRTVNQHLYIHFFYKILSPNVQQTGSQMLNCVIILHGNAHLHIATSGQLLTFQE